ncbi:MAG: hypothetical protein COA36_16735 [Desulfotalea sp.]|nr:MAG: hypothetical protein COA36_16735 [Desulfotalea sp.]
MDKNILKKIAKEWCKGILLANEGDSFSDTIDNGLLTEKEAAFILKETTKIAERITKETYSTSLELIVRKYYEIE